jgi:methionine sulfoxide reductase heme-binding subunit
MLNKFFIIAAIILWSYPISVLAEQPKVDYKDGLIIDSDLDGLTDEGEKQAYYTDPNDPDKDSDGILDGAEVFGQTDPQNSNDPIVRERVTQKAVIVQNETPWGWYVTRVTALIGFIMLYLSFFFGLAVKTPGLKRLIDAADSYPVHCWISLQALLFAIFHAASLLFDKFLTFSWKDVFVPFALKPSESVAKAGVSSEVVAFGIISFYLMIILVLTSYLRKFISYRVWRSLHYLNMGLYILVVIHALYLGTDLKTGLLRNIFIWVNIFLALLIVFNIIWKIYSSIKIKLENQDEDLRQSDSEIVQKRGSQNFRRRV